MIYSGRNIHGQAVEVTVSGEEICEVRNIPDDDNLPYLLPVLVDLQHNGAFGCAYNLFDERGIEELHAIADHLRAHGVGRCLLTITTYPLEQLEKTAAALIRFFAESAELDRLFPGIFHEGVFMSPVDGWRGAHAKPWIKPPDFDAFQRIDDAAEGRIRTVNVAPEEPGGLDFVERAAAAGKIVSLGHCCPDAKTVAEAVARGARMVTHFGNGAAPTIHRFKNPFWAFLSHPELSCGLICDGCHLPPELVATVLHCKGLDNCFPVSDASGHSGCAAGDYVGYGDRHFSIEPDGFMHLKGADVLAGSWFQQDRCVNFLVHTQGMSFLDAWRQCSLKPATYMGWALPTLAPGQEASFVQARWDDGVVIEQSIHAGKSFTSEPVRAGSGPGA